MLALLALIIAAVAMIHNYMLEATLFNLAQAMHHEVLVVALVAFAVGYVARTLVAR